MLVLLKWWNLAEKHGIYHYYKSTKDSMVLRQGGKLVWGLVEQEEPPFLTTWIIISPYSVRMWENTDQKKLRIWTLFKQWKNRFNRHLSASKSTVKRGFSLLKARWRYLLKRLDHEIENISKEITACFILHNICQMSRDECVYNDGLLENIIQQEKEARLRRRQNQMAILRLTTS